MVDIFISYASEDLEKARALAAAFEAHRYSTWWNITTLSAKDDLREKWIEREIADARLLIVILSKGSEHSEFVAREIHEANRQGKAIIPVTFDGSEWTLEQPAYPVIDLQAWSERGDADKFDYLLNSIKALAWENEVAGAAPRRPSPAPRRQSKGRSRSSRGTSWIGWLSNFFSVGSGDRGNNGTDLGKSAVICTAFSRGTLKPLQNFVIQVVVHTPEKSLEAESLAKQTDPKSQALPGYAIQATEGQSIRLELEIEGATIKDSIREIDWKGETSLVTFDVQAPDAGFEELMPVVGIYVDNLPVGRCAWIIEEAKGRENAPTKTANFSPYSRAFLSYSSNDRIAVLNFAQFLDSMKIEYFQDLLSLEPGARFAEVFETEIKKCDVFVLFWSSHAKHSSWVVKEALLAHRRRDSSLNGLPDFRVVLLEGPPPPEPPASLGSVVHFNDYIRYVISAHENATNLRQ